MQLINKIFRAIISIPVNFCCLPLKQAIHLPIHVGANVKFIHAPHKGMIEIRSKHIKRGMIKLGCDKGSFMMGTNSVIDISPQGKIIFLGGKYLLWI